MSGAETLDILLVDDDADLRDALATGLRLAGFTVHEAGNGREALQMLGTASIGAVVSDMRMPLIDGRQLLHRLMARDPALPVILITGHGDIDQAVDAIRTGAYDFLAKPFAVERLVDTVNRALDKHRLILENRLLRQQLDATEGRLRFPLIGASPAIQLLIRAIRQIGNADIDVLIEGERGTGKAAVAAMLHGAASASAATIDFIDCEFSPATAIDQALGGERGAGRGKAALANKAGGHRAHRRTLVFHHVDRLNDALQTRLLHFLEARDRMALAPGAGVPQARIVATSAATIADLAETGRFRADLYHRLASITLQVPPLRARRQDLPVLFAHLARSAADRFRREVPILSDSLIAQFNRHDWPGNLPELQSHAERIVLDIGDAGQQDDAEQSLSARVARFEADLIRAAIQRERGNIRKTCERLGLPRKTLYDKINRHGINVASIRRG